MRIVHTSDWHIGRSIKGEDRWEEVAALLDEIAFFVESERVDLMLISGDVFDHMTPPAEAEKIVYNFFSRMNRISVPVMVIAGNHDGAQRFDSRSQLFQIANVYVVGQVRKDAVFTPTTKSGEKAIVAAIPFLSEKSVVKGIEFMQKPESELKGSYTDRIEAIIRHLSQKFEEDAINLLMTHMYFEGSIPSYTERQIDMTNAYAVPSQLIPSHVNYVAVGHIHKQQQIRKTAVPAYYSGSLMKLDFGEETDEKGFLFIEALPHTPSRVERVPLSSVRKLMNFDIPYEELHARADEINRLLGETGYGKIRVIHDQPIVNLREIIKNTIPRAVDCEQKNPSLEEPRQLTFHPGALEDPIQMYKNYCTKEYGKAPDNKTLKAFQELYQEILSDETH